MSSDTRKPPAEFGRRTCKPRPIPRRASFGISPTLLAGALHREKPESLRYLVLLRLYQNLTPAEKRLCDAVRARAQSQFLQGQQATPEPRFDGSTRHG